MNTSASDTELLHKAESIVRLKRLRQQRGNINARNLRNSGKSFPEPVPRSSATVRAQTINKS